MRIKLSYYLETEPILRQTPGGLGRWKGDEFFVNDRTMDAPDVWVVLDDVADEERAAPQLGRTVLFTFEPPRTRDYQPGFLAQFDLVVSCHRNLRHPNVRNEYQGLPWHIGLHKGEDAVSRAAFRGTIDYDDFARMGSPEKSRTLSTIVSATARLPGHRMRREFADRLQARLGDQVDAYGRGVRPIPDKTDAIIPYRYHVVLENSRLADYWTEKLADAYLGWAFPFYWGCTNIGDYFPEGSLIPLDIERPEEAIALIEATIREPVAGARLDALAAARSLVLDRHNTFDVVRRSCQSLPPATPKEAVIRPQRAFQPSRLRRNSKRAIQKFVTLLRGERW